MTGLQIMERVQGEKGRVAFRFENGVEMTLYRSELHGLSAVEQQCLREGETVSDELYQKLLDEVVGLRAKKRAMHLLEQMDRTERQLYDKLKQGGYPEPCIEQAIAYVKGFHYIDDLRYARCFVRSRQSRRSMGRIRTDLLRRGVARDTIEQALAEEYDADERATIRAIIEKRHYDCGTADEREQRRMYQFLLRRGYRGSDILRVLRCAGEY